MKKPCSDCDGVVSENWVDDRCFEELVIDYDCWCLAKEIGFVV